jgi:hypothetical protein
VRSIFGVFGGKNSKDNIGLVIQNLMVAVVILRVFSYAGVMKAISTLSTKN